MTGQHRGTVAEFDDRRGYGTIRGDDGRERFFHCTAVASGTRTIEVGARVTFEVVAGHLGRWEAAGVTREAAGPSGISPAPP